MAFLHVAIFHPIGQILGTYHWTLYLESEKTRTLFQVVGESNNFTYHESEISTSPEHIAGHIENIPVAHIDDLDGFMGVVRGQHVDNEMFHWGCQQWVYDVLESLVGDEIITDYDHAEALVKLDVIFQAKIEGEG